MNATEPAAISGGRPEKKPPVTDFLVGTSSSQEVHRREQLTTAVVRSVRRLSDEGFAQPGGLLCRRGLSGWELSD